MSINPCPRERGFSLVELLIVVVVIAVVAAIAIPNLMASRRAANEGSAIADLRLFHSAQMTYSSTIGRGNFAGNTVLNGDALGELGSAGIIDTLLATGTKNGYRFSGVKIDASGSTPAAFCGRAVPVTASGVVATGPRNIAIATDGVLHAGNAVVSTTANCTVTGGSISVTAATPLND
jgi:type IV pilus assembly protein PilA